MSREQGPSERGERARRRRLAVAALAFLQRPLTEAQLAAAIGEDVSRALADAEGLGQCTSKGRAFVATSGPDSAVLVLSTHEAAALLPKLIAVAESEEEAFLLALAGAPRGEGAARARALAAREGPLRELARAVSFAIGESADGGDGSDSGASSDDDAPPAVDLSESALGALAPAAYAALGSAANQLAEGAPDAAQRLIAIGMTAEAFEGRIQPAQGILAVAVTKVLYDFGQRDEALRFCRTAQARLEGAEGASARAWLQMLEGHVLADQHRLKEARAVLTRVDVQARALGQVELSGLARTELGTISFREGQTEAAVQLLRSALERLEGTGRYEAIALHCLGHAYVKQGRWIDAQQLIAGTLDGLDSVAVRLSAHVNAVICEVMLGDHAQAARHLDALRAFAPDNAHGVASIALAEAWAQAGKGEWEAAAQRLRAIDAADRPQIAVAIAALETFCLLRLQRFDDAAAALERAATVLTLRHASRHQPAVHLLDAELAAARGDAARARRALRRLREYPEHALLWDLELRARVLDLRLAKAEGDEAKAGRARAAATVTLERLWAMVGPARRLAFERTLDRAALLAELGVQPALAAVEVPYLRGRSQAFRETIAQLQRVAPSTLSVLLIGETGTGKELCARALHELSDRHAGPFVALNCAALTDELLLSELFGHEAGAFTGAQALRIGRFEQADGGTLFLDEISELSPRGQASLLRALQEGTFERLGSTELRRADVRVVAATNRAIDPSSGTSDFRHDLYFRLAAAQVQVPPLRARGDDVLELAEEFLGEAAAARGGTRRILSDEARALLRTHQWPGNVRELKNVIRTVDVMGEGETLGADAFVPFLRGDVASASGAIDYAAQLRRSGGTLREYLDQVQRACVRAALERSEGNITRAAAELGLSRSRMAELVAADPELQRKRTGRAV